MRKTYTNTHQYRFTKPPKALLKARFDNIAIVPASMLPFKNILKEKLHTLPNGGVLLCHAKENTKQRKVFERLETVFKEQGHFVANLSLEQVL